LVQFIIWGTERDFPHFKQMEQYIQTGCACLHVIFTSECKI